MPACFNTKVGLGYVFLITFLTQRLGLSIFDQNLDWNNLSKYNTVLHFITVINPFSRASNSPDKTHLLCFVCVCVCPSVSGCLHGSNGQSTTKSNQAISRTTKFHQFVLGRNNIAHWNKHSDMHTLHKRHLINSQWHRRCICSSSS